MNALINCITEAIHRHLRLLIVIIIKKSNKKSIHHQNNKKLCLNCVCPAASPDGKPFRLYRIQLNNLGSSSVNCPSPVGATPRATRTALRREPKDLSPSPPAKGSPSRTLRTAGAARKDLRIRLEHQGSFGSGSGTPGSPASSRNLKGNETNYNL